MNKFKRIILKNSILENNIDLIRIIERNMRQNTNKLREIKQKLPKRLKT